MDCTQIIFTDRDYWSCSLTLAAISIFLKIFHISLNILTILSFYLILHWTVPQDEFDMHFCCPALHLKMLMQLYCYWSLSSSINYLSRVSFSCFWFLFCYFSSLFSPSSNSAIKIKMSLSFTWNCKMSRIYIYCLCSICHNLWDYADHCVIWSGWLSHDNMAF